MMRDQELEHRKEAIKTAPIEDYLLEDPPVYNQNFFILSYLLPNDNNELQFPAIKIRGSFKNQDDCQKRINQLKNLDPYFNMYVCEVGKFGSLLPEDEIKKMDDVDIEYRETILNTMAKEYQENKHKADEEFIKRKEFMEKQAKLEGSLEGQKLLANKKEDPIAVRTRIENMRNQLNELQEKIKEVNEIIRISTSKLENDYLEEEITEAEQKYNQQFSQLQTTSNKELFNSDDIFLSKKEKE